MAKIDLLKFQAFANQKKKLIELYLNNDFQQLSYIIILNDFVFSFAY